MVALQLSDEQHISRVVAHRSSLDPHELSYASARAPAVH
jgi:hypothetical protein